MNSLRIRLGRLLVWWIHTSHPTGDVYVGF